jgi:hypothetical protein
MKSREDILIGEKSLHCPKDARLIFFHSISWRSAKMLMKLDTISDGFSIARATHSVKSEREEQEQ